MCGIVGYIGKRQAAPVLLSGLEKLEYRGYDSAGIAVYSGDKIEIVKTKGRLKLLYDMTNGGNSVSGNLGIGHTRWATHGEPSDVNSHPHVNEKGDIAVVHNGIIENYVKVKEYLIKKGYTFVSETDTEVIAHLVDYYYNGDMLDTIIKVINRVEGSYALGIVSSDFPNTLYAVRKDSPLIVGLGKEENFIASDIPAVLQHTRDTYLLNDDEIVVLTANHAAVYNTDKEIVKKDIFHVDWDVSAAEKGGYEHFMFKEIMEQPKAIRDTISPRIVDGKIVLDNILLTKEYINNISKIYIVACGSASYAGAVGKYVIEDLARISVECDIASEFRYRNPIIDENTLVIVISQSGETADTIAAMREAKKKGARVLSVVNVVGSSIARESDDVLYTWAGPEIAVATTKAYSTQLTAMYMLAVHFAVNKGTVTQEQADEIIQEMEKLPEKAESLLNQREDIQYFASKYYNVKDVFFMGRSTDYAVAMEGSLKLKEISYIHSEAYAAGELKHGTISLIEDGTLVVAVMTHSRLCDKMVSNIKEVKARGAKIVAIAQEGDEGAKEIADFLITVPIAHPVVVSSLTVIPLQLFGYYIAAIKGLDVDKPRNLAKSVTVE